MEAAVNGEISPSSLRVILSQDKYIKNYRHRLNKPSFCVGCYSNPRVKVGRIILSTKFLETRCIIHAIQCTIVCMCLLNCPRIKGTYDYFDHLLLCSGCAKGSLKIWDTKSSRHKTTYQLPDGLGGVNGLVGLQGRCLGVGTTTGSIIILDWVNLRVAQVLGDHTKSIVHLTLISNSNGETNLLSTSLDKTIRIWRTRINKTNNTQNLPHIPKISGNKEPAPANAQGTFISQGVITSQRLMCKCVPIPHSNHILTTVRRLISREKKEMEVLSIVDVKNKRIIKSVDALGCRGVFGRWNFDLISPNIALVQGANNKLELWDTQTMKNIMQINIHVANNTKLLGLLAYGTRTAILFADQEIFIFLHANNSQIRRAIVTRASSILKMSF